jgi:hypothetical protein
MDGRMHGRTIGLLGHTCMSGKNNMRNILAKAPSFDQFLEQNQYILTNQMMVNFHKTKRSVITRIVGGPAMCIFYEQSIVWSKIK